MGILNQDYFARPYQKGDEYQIVSLLRLIFENWPYYDVECDLVDHWRWRYLDNPFKMSIVTCAESNGQIIGVNHGLPTMVKMGEEKYKGAYYTNFGVHPDFRRMGVSKKIGVVDAEQYAKAGIDFLYLVTVNPVVIKSSYKTQIIFPHQIKNFVWIKDIQTHIDSSKIENPFGMKASFYTKSVVNRLRFSVKSLNPNIKVTITQKFGSKLDEFWDEVRLHYDFIVERDRTYLNWRYCDKRGGNYRVFLSEEQGKVLGYVVLSINKLELYHKGYFVDLVVNPNRIDAAYSLIDTALGFFEENNVNLVEFQLVHGDPVERVLRDYGFQESKNNRHFFVSPEIKDILVENKSRLIHFSFGDLSGI